MFNTPVLLIIFNRPNHAKKVLDRIRSIKPARLYIAADGPRTTHTEDYEKCRSTREVVASVDWPCELKTLFREENLGCGRGPAEAISWFFKNEEEGIILEDDCLPEIFFFKFCSELLSYYRNEEQVMHISGNNFQHGIIRGNASYYFSAYNHNWGWATWRRCWSKFQYLIPDFNQNNLCENLKSYGFNKIEREFWASIFGKINQAPPKDIWDYQWGYTIWRNSGVCILPNVNLVKNIGFDEEATHTKNMPLSLMQMKSGEIERIVHPTAILLNSDADHYTFNTHFHRRDPFWRRFKNKLILNSFIRWFYENVQIKFGKRPKK